MTNRRRSRKRKGLWTKGQKMTVCIASIVLAICICNLFLGGNKESIQQGEVVRFEQQELTAKELYDTEFQAEREVQVETLKENATYSFDNILFVYNPYGLNVQSMYVYFETSRAATVSYNIHVEKKEIPDFERSFYNGEEKNYTKTHEYQMIGLVPGVENTITFTILYKSGIMDTKEITFTPNELSGPEDLIMPSTEGTSKQELSDGLYAVFAEERYMYYYDNAGVIRSEFPIINYRSHRLLFKEDKMYFSISHTQMVEMNSLGQVTRVFDMGEFDLHHDYVFDDDGNIIILGTLTKYFANEDRILKLDLETGLVSEIIDMADFFPDYFEKYKANLETDSLNAESYGLYDWIHLNTVSYLGNDTIIVSAREASTIIKISDIYGTPKIEYMMGEESFWEETGYENLLIDKTEDFRSQTGQHTVTYKADASLPAGQYYLSMFNNNSQKSITRPDYDWSIKFGELNTKMFGGDTSYYYRYLVDENEGTYKLVGSFEVPYSGYVSSTQEMENGNIIVDSGSAFTLGEYDSDYQLIKSFEIKKIEKIYCYRVFKYDFNGFYFYEK